MKQLADIKILLPAITGALKDGQGFNLNMIGPIYVGGSNNETKQIEGPREIERVFISADDLFSEDMTIVEFKRRMTLAYFRIVASRNSNSADRVVKILGIGPQTATKYAREAGINLK